MPCPGLVNLGCRPKAQLGIHLKRRSLRKPGCFQPAVSNRTNMDKFYICASSSAMKKLSMEPCRGQTPAKAYRSNTRTSLKQVEYPVLSTNGVKTSKDCVSSEKPRFWSEEMAPSCKTVHCNGTQVPCLKSASETQNA